MIKYVVTALGGVAVGILLAKLIAQIKENKKLEYAKILENCFGEPMYTNNFSLAEARDWIKSRKEKLENGAKAVILKANSETLQNIGKDLDIGEGPDKNIVIAIINETTKEIEDSVLIRYEVLDDELDAILEKGKGILVVEA